MKSGTSTLHAILDSHPDVHIPEGEIGFFSLGDWQEHGDQIHYDAEKDEWIMQDWLGDPDRIWSWYRDIMRSDKPVVGEDSTTYFSSRLAAERIAIQRHPIKMIFLMRNPVDRAYSQYHHLLRSGRTQFTFESALQYAPKDVLHRGDYVKYLETYYELMDERRIKVILFEDFVRDTRSVMQELCDFIGLDFGKFTDDAFDTHANSGKYPKYVQLQILKNRWLRQLGNIQHSSLPFDMNNRFADQKTYVRYLHYMHRLINPLSKKKVPPMKQSTRDFLEKYYRQNLQGIDELTGKPCMQTWFGVKSTEV